MERKRVGGAIDGRGRGGRGRRRWCLALALSLATPAAALPSPAHLLTASPAQTVRGNSPPATPVVTEPAFDGKITNPEDTHMECGPFFDPDPGDTHACTDWEIWTITPSQRIWAALCVTGPEKTHIHLADGVFQGSHAGRTTLMPETNFRLRVRHKDSSGDPFTQWSGYGLRLFTTGALSSVFPMEVDDVADSPVPSLRDTAGVPVALPFGASPAALRLESGLSEAVLVLTGGAGGQNQITNPPPIAEHEAVRVRLVAGGQALLLPETDLAFTDHTGVDHVVFLPAVSLGAGQSAYYWVSANGSTYVGQASQTQPVFTTLARSAAVPWTARPGFRVEHVASGFQLPVNIAFIPNPGPAPDAPLFYVTELYGTIKVVRRNGAVGIYAGNLLNFDPGGAFPGSGEQGLAGIVVDPATGDLFCTLLYDFEPPSEEHYPKIVRFHSNNGGLTAATQTIILNMVGELQGQSHQISNISIGPDGKLYVHVGDGFDPLTALNMESFRGKIIRMNFNGTAPTDNPFYNAGNGITARDYIYAYGFRNPFGGAWRASDGKHYEVENGPDVDRFARVNAGQNFMWNGQLSTMYSGALYNWDPAVAPVNIAFVQPSTFGGSQFPSSMQGHAFVTQSGATYGTGPQENGKRITEWVLSSTGTLLSGPDTLIEYNGSGKATCVGLAAGPDGLYFTDLYKDEGYQSPVDPGANVLRVRFVGVANFTSSVTSGPAPLAVQFTDLSTVPGASAWLWTFGDGATSTAQHPFHVYTEEGVYNVRLSVTGSTGLAVLQRNGYIEVGQVPSVALVAGSLPLGPGDQAMADHLTANGLAVEAYDDEPVNRPGAHTLAALHDAVLVSSTVEDWNIADEFRTVAVPLIFCEPGLLQMGFEPLANDYSMVGNVFGINVVNTSHPITQGLVPGLNGVFSPGANMGVGRGTIAPGATLLATRGASALDYTILAAPQGAALLGGYVAPARRVFLFFGDNAFVSATPDAKEILLKSVCWAAQFGGAIISQQPAPVSVPPGQQAQFHVSAAGPGVLVYQWRRNGVNLIDDGRITGALTSTLTINPVQTTDAGLYDVLVMGSCGGAASAPAVLIVQCYPDCNADANLTVADFGCFQAKFVSQDPYADCNGDQALTIADFGCFQGLFVAGCP